MSDTRLAAIAMPGEAEPWSALGFTVADGAIGFANGAIRIGASGCSFEVEQTERTEGADGTESAMTDLEGIPIRHVEGDALVEPVDHANGAVELDHVVITTDSLERTSAVVESVLGLAQRRVRETGTVRQAFHRFADVGDVRGCIVEIVENPRVSHSEIWGVVVIVDDLDAAVAGGGGLISEAKPAVQPGRRIATVSRAAGLPMALAVMSR